MENEELQAHLLVLNQVVTQIISQMPPVAAARAAVGLAMERHSPENQHPLDSQHMIDMRNGLMDAYLALLQSVAQRG